MNKLKRLIAIGLMLSAINASAQSIPNKNYLDYNLIWEFNNQWAVPGVGEYFRYIETSRIQTLKDGSRLHWIKLSVNVNGMREYQTLYTVVQVDCKGKKWTPVYSQAYEFDTLQHTSRKPYPWQEFEFTKKHDSQHYNIVCK